MKLYTRLLAALLLLGLSSCSEKILNEIDTNPNQLNDAPLSTLLPQATVTTLFQTSGSITASGAGIMAELYTLTDVSSQVQSYIQIYGNGSWDGSYIALRNYAEVRQKAEAEQKWGYVAVADILSAYTLSMLVDLFGDVPYAQALKGAANRQPTFDKAQDLYPEMLRLLDSGIQNADKATVATQRPGKDDLIFGGNMALWKKTANGLKARLFNRLSNTDPSGTAQKALAAIDGSFAANETFAATFYTTIPANANPMANAQFNQSTVAVGNGIVAAMRSFLDDGEDVLADPRAAIWFTRIGGKVVPAPNGRASTDVTIAGTLYSKPQHLRERAAPQPLLTPVELKFIEAECQLRLGDRAKAYAAYETALRAALAQAAQFNPAAALSAAQINAYLARPKVLPGAATLTLEQIIAQKYIYFFVFQPIEAYNDLRRTAFLKTTDPDGTPKRIPVPDSERGRNASAPTIINERTMYEDIARLFWAKL
ncbi:MAG: SusD/RagB family nutrient-binding outer membrane lipoprotein [Cytophagaceae bacterium]|nr:SusD/RagB family nutrient-binding outer membrane lipoprotein [Cytophagaceae bacterium]